MINLDNLSCEIDHRRDRAEQVELLLIRLELLKLPDRVLLEAYLRHSVSYRNLGLISGLSETVVSRRVNAQIGRLLADEYIAILRNKKSFNSAELAIAYDRFLLGSSYRAIANRQKISFFKVRKIIAQLNLWLKGHRKGKQ